MKQLYLQKSRTQLRKTVIWIKVSKKTSRTCGRSHHRHVTTHHVITHHITLHSTCNSFVHFRSFQYGISIKSFQVTYIDWVFARGLWDQHCPLDLGKAKPVKMQEVSNTQQQSYCHNLEWGGVTVGIPITNSSFQVVMGGCRPSSFRLYICVVHWNNPLCVDRNLPYETAYKALTTTQETVSWLSWNELPSAHYSHKATFNVSCHLRTINGSLGGSRSRGNHLSI